MERYGMPNGKDPNWKQMIVDIHGDVQVIKKEVSGVVEDAEALDDRVSLLELAKARANGYRKAKEHFYEKHPVKTAVGGSVTIGGLVTLALLVLEKLGVF